MSIYSRLQGGLGNQLFQYAAGRALALRNDTDLVLDDSLLGSRRFGVTPRNLEIFKLPVAARLANGAEKKAIRREVGLFPRLAKRLNFSSGSSRLLRDRGFGFDPGFNSSLDGTILEGYWQSEMYFLNIRPLLLKEVSVALPIGSAEKAMGDEVIAAGASSISIHVRRGDYVSNPRANAYHGCLTLEYYRGALDLVRRYVHEPQLFVFSDDPSWVAHAFDVGIPFRNISAHKFQPLAEMMLMRSCRINVIANSSFSWWAAWLNESSGKTVVAPERWVRDQTQPPDLLPQSWLKVSLT